MKKQTVNINVEQLINQVSKYPQIYNPDHKDFYNPQITQDIFNSSISKEMDGINGEILNRKWIKILRKYASFIRKLSHDDSSATLLEKFMEWPWTKHMRIFKPYVRKQFKIPIFQASAMREFDAEIEELGLFPVPSTSDEFRSAIIAAGPMVERPLLPRPVATIGFRPPAPGPDPDLSPDDAVRPLDLSPTHHRVQLPSYIENLIISTVHNQIQMSTERQDVSAFQNIAAIMGIDQFQSDRDDTSDTDLSESVTDEEIVTDDKGADGSPPQPKKIKIDHGQSGSTDHEGGIPVDNPDTNIDGNDVDDDILPDLPQPKSPLNRKPWEFTAQEHIFLAWAKTMSTFTAKRQATIKMKINKIMSEAEFEDLDDEFFGGI